MPPIANWLHETLSSVGWVVIIGAAWKLSGRIATIETGLANVVSSINLLLTNHLPHIQDELQGLRQEMLQRRNGAPTSNQVGGGYVE